ncbi:MAG: hypothetical protein LUE22_10400 [Oscillospiraceae bacterium]|nr:hypothetical protein [Oscillospiraceae bacterium]
MFRVWSFLIGEEVIQAWDLKIEKQIAFNMGYGTSKLLRFLKAFEKYWHAEGMKSAYSGTIELNGIAYRVIPEKTRIRLLRF